MDADKQDRSSQPIYLSKEGSNQFNKLNAYMDHCWDGFYTCQKRLQRFHGIVQGGPDAVYNVTYTGTPPEKQLFFLQSNDEEAGATFRIHYPNAKSRSLVRDGKIIEYNIWDEA